MRWEKNFCTSPRILKFDWNSTKYFHDVHCHWWNMVHNENMHDILCPKGVDNVKSTLCSNITVHWLILHQRFQKQTLTKSSGVTNLRRVLITRKAIENSKHNDSAQDLYILSYVTCSNIYGVEKNITYRYFDFYGITKEISILYFSYFLIINCV